jgi:septum formation protein
MIDAMLNELLKDHKVVLGSSSPRRQQFLKSMGIDFTVRPSWVEEVYPDDLQASQISDYLARLKADSLKDSLEPNEILITSDTVVWHRGKSLEKASNSDEAREMLQTLSGDTHEVITSVCISSVDKQLLTNQRTSVTLYRLSDEEINYYVEQFKPFDKAGAYGIQEWIGLVGIKRIEGSYTNVVGLPTAVVYNSLKEFLTV